jgi:hypothetical protein
MNNVLIKLILFTSFPVIFTKRTCDDCDDTKICGELNNCDDLVTIVIIYAEL